MKNQNLLEQMTKLTLRKSLQLQRKPRKKLLKIRLVRNPLKWQKNLRLKKKFRKNRCRNH